MQEFLTSLLRKSIDLVNDFAENPDPDTIETAHNAILSEFDRIWTSLDGPGEKTAADMLDKFLEKRADAYFGYPNDYTLAPFLLTMSLCIATAHPLLANSALQKLKRLSSVNPRLVTIIALALITSPN